MHVKRNIIRVCATLTCVAAIGRIIFEDHIQHMYAIEHRTVFNLVNSYEISGALSLLVPSIVVVSMYPSHYVQECLIVTAVYILLVSAWMTSVNMMHKPLSTNVDTAIVYNGGCIALAVVWIMGALAPMNVSTPAPDYPTAPPVYSEDEGGEALTYM